MKVKDLIIELQAMDENAEVVITSENFELRGANVSASRVYQYDQCKKITRQFRDAFDGDTYFKEVWSLIDGDTSVVMLSE